MLTTYHYQSEHTICFDLNNGELMVNATEMAKPFGKQPAHFLRMDSTKQYVEAISRRYAKSHTDFIKVINGGNAFGTWLHQKLALRFAQWLSPDFAIWVDERIEELLTKGRTELAPASPLALARQMLEALEANEQRLAAVEGDVRRIEAKVTNVNDEYYSLSGWYKLAGRRWDLDLTAAQRMGRQLAQASRLNGYEVLKAHDAKYGRVNTYHASVLAAVLGFDGLQGN